MISSPAHTRDRAPHGHRDPGLMTPEAWAIFISVFSALGAFLFGLDIGYIAPILECSAFKRDVARLPDWNNPASHIDDLTVGFIVGSFSVGAILTSLPPVSGYFLDQWGRRSSIVLGSAVFLVGAACQAEARTIAMMIAGRFVAGMSIGLLSAVVALYQTELAPPGLRGSLTSLYQLMITFGIFVAAFLDAALVESSSRGWRLAIWVQCVPAVGLLLVMPFLPRSPRWLVAQGRKDEALDALLVVRSSAEEARKELEEIVESFEQVRAMGEFRWSDLLDPHIFRLLTLGISLQMLQQLVGMNAFMYFGPRIFIDTGHDANLYQTYLNLLNFLSTFFALFLADRCGRKPLLAASALGMTAACLTIGCAGTFASASAGGPWIIFSIFFFVINFSYGWGPMVWVYTSEMFPLRVRGYCVATTACSNWVGNLVIAQFTPVLLGYMSFKTFFVFAFFTAISLALSLWLPETKGVMLEKLDTVFRHRFHETAALAGSPSARANYGSVPPLTEPPHVPVV